MDVIELFEFGVHAVSDPDVLKLARNLRDWPNAVLNNPPIYMFWPNIDKEETLASTLGAQEVGNPSWLSNEATKLRGRGLTSANEPPIYMFDPFAYNVFTPPLTLASHDEISPDVLMRKICRGRKSVPSTTPNPPTQTSFPLMAIDQI